MKGQITFIFCHVFLLLFLPLASFFSNKFDKLQILQQKKSTSKDIIDKQAKPNVKADSGYNGPLQFGQCNGPYLGDH